MKYFFWNSVLVWWRQTNAHWIIVIKWWAEPNSRCIGCEYRRDWVAYLCKRQFIWAFNIKWPTVLLLFLTSLVQQFNEILKLLLVRARRESIWLCHLNKVQFTFHIGKNACESKSYSARWCIKKPEPRAPVFNGFNPLIINGYSG